jgi:hypothetical protein
MKEYFGENHIEYVTILGNLSGVFEDLGYYE